MEPKRSWWQQIKMPLLVIGVVAASAIVIILIVVEITFYGTGFNGYAIVTTSKTTSGAVSPPITTTTVYQPGKTLWDWMQLLFIPVVLAIAGFWFNHRERKAAELLAENERKAAELRSVAEREIEQKRAMAEQEIALDNQREAALQAYLDRVSELLLQTNLSEEKPDKKVLMLIRARTLITLKRLDPDRKTSLFGFLWEAGLIGKFNLDHADFSGADLSGANLRGVKLRKANLSRANLHGVTLDEALLLYTNLRGANLSRTMIDNADLRGADLTDADLTDAYLTKTNMNGAVCSEEQLKQAKSIKGATMPDGSVHP